MKTPNRRFKDAIYAQFARIGKAVSAPKRLELLDVEAVDGDELLRHVRNGEVTILDVRPPEEYRAGHIPDALSVPLPELKRRLARLPKGREVVAYCRGPYCVMAIEAVELLRKKGFRAWGSRKGRQNSAGSPRLGV